MTKKQITNIIFYLTAAAIVTYLVYATGISQWKSEGLSVVH